MANKAGELLRDKLRSHYRVGITARELAEALGASKRLVAYHAAQAGLPLAKEPPGVRPANARRKQALTSVAKGHYHDGLTIKIDENPAVALCPPGEGGWVQAWVYVGEA